MSFRSRLTYTGQAGRILACAPCEGGASVASGSADGSVHVWRVEYTTRAGGAPDRYTGIVGARLQGAAFRSPSLGPVGRGRMAPCQALTGWAAVQACSWWRLGQGQPPAHFLPWNPERAWGAAQACSRRRPGRGPCWRWRPGRGSCCTPHSAAACTCGTCARAASPGRCHARPPRHARNAGGSCHNVHSSAASEGMMCCVFQAHPYSFELSADCGLDTVTALQLTKSGSLAACRGPAVVHNNPKPPFSSRPHICAGYGLPSAAAGAAAACRQATSGRLQSRSAVHRKRPPERRACRACWARWRWTQTA